MLIASQRLFRLLVLGGVFLAERQTCATRHNGLSTEKVETDLIYTVALWNTPLTLCLPDATNDAYASLRHTMLVCNALSLFVTPYTTVHALSDLTVQFGTEQGTTQWFSGAFGQHNHARYCFYLLSNAVFDLRFTRPCLRSQGAPHETAETHTVRMLAYENGDTPLCGLVNQRGVRVVGHATNVPHHDSFCPPWSPTDNKTNTTHIPQDVPTRENIAGTQIPRDVPVSKDTAFTARGFEKYLSTEPPVDNNHTKKVGIGTPEPVVLVRVSASSSPFATETNTTTGKIALLVLFVFSLAIFFTRIRERRLRDPKDDSDAHTVPGTNGYVYNECANGAHLQEKYTATSTTGYRQACYAFKVRCGVACGCLPSACLYCAGIRWFHRRGLPFFDEDDVCGEDVFGDDLGEIGDLVQYEEGESWDAHPSSNMYTPEHYQFVATTRISTTPERYIIEEEQVGGLGTLVQETTDAS